ncbi:MAG: pilus assembly protein N-terminal domain-containing protein [Schwartzia sp.]|nr:pilus assembly protein N-terminal domain-containing protein [Schwartzia sp. (in: firmicutes)]
MKTNHLLGRAALGAATSLFLAAPVAFASQTINLLPNDYEYMTSEVAITRIAIANPEIADVQLLPSGMEFLVVANQPGSTSLLVWDENGVMREYRIVVGADNTGLAETIQRAIGLPGVRVSLVPESISDKGTASGKYRILLQGKVKNQHEHDKAIQIARLYNGANEVVRETKAEDDDKKFEYNFDYTAQRIYENIIDLLEIENPVQIRLEAQIIELSVDDDSNIGLQFKSATAMEYTELGDTGKGFTSVTLGDTGVFYGGEDFKNHDTGFWVWDHFTHINASLNLLISKGKAKVLSRPNISALSGSKAKIHIGGSIPVPKSNGNGDVTFEWKDYGIRLNIRPTVDEGGKTITAEVHAEASTLDYAHMVKSDSTEMPALTTRNAHSIIHMNNEGTMVIGGLMNSQDSKVVTKIPLLSSIPIIGEFFKHTSTQNDKRELVILITPRIVNPEDPVRMSDKMKEWYEKGQQEESDRNDVDVNAPLPKPTKEKKEEERQKKEAEERAAAEREAREALADAEADYQLQSPILAQYAGQSVAEREKRAAERDRQRAAEEKRQATERPREDNARTQHPADEGDGRQAAEEAARPAPEQRTSGNDMPMTPEERRVVESPRQDTPRETTRPDTPAQEPQPIDVTKPVEDKEYSFLPKYMGRE